MPSELAPAVTEVTVSVSMKSPKDVSNIFVKIDPRVVGVGLVKLMIVEKGTKPVLSVTILVTTSGAPDVMVAAVATLPVSAVKGVVATKLNWVEIVSAKAGEAAIKAAQATAARSAWREFTTLMTASLID